MLPQVLYFILLVGIKGNDLLFKQCLSLRGDGVFCAVLAIYISSLTFVSGWLVAIWLAMKVNVF